MPKEIERRFLVNKETWNKIVTKDMRCVIIQQAYLKSQDGTVDRVRIQDGVAYRTIKSNFNGISCDEHETEIPMEEGKKLLMTAVMTNKGHISKTRTFIPFGNLKIEVDEFWYPDNLKDLVIAEVELPFEVFQFEVPEWFGEEISGRREWNNVSLLKNGIPNDIPDNN